MRKIGRWIIGFAISLLLSGGFLIMSFIVPKTVRVFYESDIVSLEGRFDGIEEIDDHYLMSLQNAPFKLYIEKEGVLESDRLMDLSEGETVRFGVLQVVADNINQFETITIITLEVGEENIMTLESYQAANRAQIEKMRAGSTIIGIICFGIGVLCFVKIIQKKKNRK